MADAWHKRLVRYYSYFGFQRVRAVGDNGLRDLPDLLVWGGVGEHLTLQCAGLPITLPSSQSCLDPVMQLVLLAQEKHCSRCRC